jgi:hypothetical protein
LIFFQVFLNQSINIKLKIIDEDIRTAIKNANGLRPSLFVPEDAFENLVK